MDFHSLTRRELQALCKKNGIPANITNLAMADALTALNAAVQGIEDISDCSKSVTAHSSVESPERVEVTSPRVPRTRTTRNKVESSTVVNKATTTTTRRLTRNKKEGVAPINIDVQFSEVDEQREISKGKEACIPQTPSMVSDTRKRSSKAEITATKTYGTRRSTRLAAKTFGHTDTSVENKDNPDAANMKLFSADCGDNFEMNDLSEDVRSTVSHLKEDASETSKCEEILSNYSALESPKESYKIAEKVKIDEENAIFGNIENKGDDINEKANIENKDEIIGENVNDTNEQEVVMMDEVDGNNDDGNLVLKMMDMSLASKDGVITQTVDQAVSDVIVVDTPMSEEEEHVLVKVATVEQVDKVDCDEPSHEYSIEDEFFPKSEVEDLVNGGLLAETENHAVSDAIVVDESVPMSEEEEHVLVKVAAGEHVDKIDCDEPSQEYSKEYELLPKSGAEDPVNVAAGEQLVNSEGNFLFDSMSSDEDEEEDLDNVVVGKQLVNGESDKPSQENSKDNGFSTKSFSMEELLEEEGSEEESEEGSEEESDDETEEESESEDETEEESEEEDLVDAAVGGQLVNYDGDKPSELISKDETEEESEDDLVNAAVGGLLVNCDGDKPSGLISKEDEILPKSVSMEEYKEEEGSKDELEGVEDVVKVAAEAQLDNKASENSEEDAGRKASIFVDDSEGILLLPAVTAAPPTAGKKNPSAVVTGKENLEELSLRQIRKMIKDLNINADSKNHKKDNLVDKSGEELVVETAPRPALQILAEKQQH